MSLVEIGIIVFYMSLPLGLVLYGAWLVWRFTVRKGLPLRQVMHIFMGKD